MQDATTRTRMTADEFIALPERGLPTELIDGELVMRGSPTLNHQRFARMIFQLVSRWVTGGEVFFAPISVKFDNANFYQPDVLWVSDDNPNCELVHDGINGAPDLVVEVLLPGTAKSDYGIKFQTYERYGVREYWIADPQGFILVWQRNDAGRFVQHGAFGAGETFSSPLLGQSVSMDEVLP
jgi:Uma2 family endonuclease